MPSGTPTQSVSTRDPAPAQGTAPAPTKFGTRSAGRATRPGSPHPVARLFQVGPGNQAPQGNLPSCTARLSGVELPTPSYSLTSATGLYKSQSVQETPPHRRALPSFTVRAPPGSAQPAPVPIIPGDPATGSIPWIATLTGHCSPAQRASPGSCNVPQEPAPGGPTPSRPGNRHTPGHPLPARCALRLGRATDGHWP